VAQTFVPGDQASKPPEGLDRDGNPVRVIVADDEAIVRKLVSQVVKSAGYEMVGEAANGRIAVELYRSTRPGLVILDVKMPVLDGLGALKEIMKEDPSARVVVLTSEAEKELVTEIIKSGAKAYVVKPLDRESFLQKLRRVRGMEGGT